MKDDDRLLDEELASEATLTLAKLHTSDPFYTPIEERFERITRLACRALDSEVAALTVIKDDRQWFKSVRNWSVTELPLSESLCSEVFKTGKEIFVEDTLDDLHLMSNPFVCHAPKFRFYAGFPLRNSEGETAGTFCVLDSKPRKVDSQFETAFKDLGHMAQRELFSTELYSAQAELVAKLGESRRAAMFDPLTHLWNRRGGMALINEVLRDAQQFDHSFGLCMADLDDFKSVNDRFGHGVGDEVLLKSAAAIVRAVRPDDIVCRYGGEEFIVLIRDVDARACFRVAERIRASISQSPIRTREATVPTTISMGIAIREKGDDRTLEQLVQAADQALYKSKDTGRDRITFAAVPDP